MRRVRAALVCLLTLVVGVAMAESTLYFDIAAQPVPDALGVFAAQTDMQLLYRHDEVGSARASRVLGHFQKAEALRQLLRGTGLEVVFVGDNAASIRRPTRGRSAPGAGSEGKRTSAVERRDARASTLSSGARASGRRARGDGTESEDAGRLEEVTVTGSRIRRISLDTLQPTSVLDGRSIDEGTSTTLGDAFAQLPAFGPPGNSPVGGQSGVGVGQSFVNFLGLGSQRTLTLVDGRRFVAANTPSINGATAPGLQVDLNAIPAALVERVEIVAVGGAPLYGADAVAGTVNIIRKKDFAGLRVAAQAGATEQGGAGRRRLQATLGRDIDDARGNVSGSFEFSEQAGMRATDRAVTAEGFSFQAPADPAAPFRQVLTADTRAVLVNFAGLPLTAPVANRTDNFRFAVKDAAGRPLQFDRDGALVPFDPGRPTGSAVFAGGGDGLDLAETTSLLTRSERSLGNLFFDYDLSDAASLTVEGWYARTQARELANQPAFNESSFRTPAESASNVLQGPIPLRLDNPFLPETARAVIARNIDFDGDGAPDAVLDYDGDGVAETRGFWLAKGHQDLLGGNPSVTEQNLYRGVIGLRGVASLAGRAVEWDVSYNRGRTDSTSHNRVILNREFNRAIDVVSDPLTGQPRCRDPDGGRCAPLDLFGFGAPSAAAADYVTVPTVARSHIEQRVWSANVTGSPLSLPAGALKVAAGAEHRSESAAFAPDEVTSSGAARGAPLTPIGGGFDTQEVYVEALVPVIGPHQKVRHVHALDLESAARYVDHSTAGDAVTWTAGLRYAPTSGIHLRGNYTKSIRAPAITELFLPTTTVFSLAADPCDRRFINQGSNAARRAANCSLAGIAQPFSSRIVNATQPVTVEGNRALGNETARAWTVGAVVQPDFAPGLTLTVDWIDIRLQDAIERFDATTVLQACYDSADFPDAAVCRRFRRADDGQLLDLRTGFLNAGAVDFAGLTADLSYEADLARAGALSVTLRYFYLDELDVSVTGSDFNAAAGEITNSRQRAAATLVYSKGPVRASLLAQYVGPAVFDRSDGPRDRDVKGVNGFWAANVGAVFALSDSVSLQLNVDNVLDERPPFASMAGTLGVGASGAIATYFPGVLGRSYAVGARVQF